MKQFIVFIEKEFFHVFRDQKTLLLLFGMPIAQIILFGFALTNEIKNTRIVVLDHAHDQSSQRIIAKLDASDQFDIERSITSPAEIAQEFQKGRVRMAVIFPENFHQDLFHLGSGQIQIVADAADPNTATTITGYATNIIQEYSAELIANSAPGPIQTTVRMIYNPELKGTTNFVPGVMALVLLLICVLMTSVSIVREKELGTMEILLVSPVHPVMVILSKAIPYFLLSLVNLTVIIVLSTTVMKMPMHGSILLLYVASALLILTALALGLLISNATQSQQAAMLISLMGMLMPTMMFTGFMFPLENMPPALQVIANIVPSKWYYTIVKTIMIKGGGLDAVWKEMSVLALMAAVLLGISIKKFNVRLT